MHDPLYVAFEIRRPWPQRSRFGEGRAGARRWQIRYHHECGQWCGDDATKHQDSNPFPWWKPRSYSPFWTLAGRNYYWPTMITIWHREPDGHDSGQVCKQYAKIPGPDGQWTTKLRHGWRFHLHHWHLQIRPLQDLRRRLLTRCTWCHGRHHNNDPINISHQWDSAHGRWWRGEPGLYHQDCSAVASAHSRCLCANPILSREGYGSCIRCGKTRAYGSSPDLLEHQRILVTIPAGTRDTDKYQDACTVIAHH